MTYAVLADNLYFNALANGSTKVNESETGGAEWFKSELQILFMVETFSSFLRIFSINDRCNRFRR